MFSRLHLRIFPIGLSIPVVLLVSTGVTGVFVSYANDFVSPDYIVNGNLGRNTFAAQATIVQWAKESAVGGPWSVTMKPFAAPTGDKHDYLSWSPYWWPDCSGVGNTTELAQEQIWTTCPYKNKDGLFNPDARLVDDVGNFQSVSDAVFYNSMAWSLTQTPTFAESATQFIKTWFLDEATRMNPNLNYAQVIRGPNNAGGTHTGVLDLKCMAKIVSGILILRKTNSTAWTSEVNDGMNAWVTEYVHWLETANIAIQEALSTNNHGTFYYNQLAALKILLGDLPGAKNVTDTYFNTIYMGQIVKGGEQPLEAARTRPYHYRAYNLAAMITNARLSQYADPQNPVWNKTTKEGATIKDALNFAMTISASASKEDNYTSELFPNIVAVASVYGDPDGKYVSFMKQAEPQFAAEADYLWDQPFAVQEGLASSSTVSSPTPSAGSNKSATGRNSASSRERMDYYGLFGIMSFLVYLLI
ncbi:chondroitin AC/alginate lyase [Macrolepiota fuliginosa MF-IS2]|uniref:Chondroitin AC/alginate lyase n=1 Tax=Macrolepiota fuliginosa MF-IS2 TaxID=1400762 RepID=A0A9P6C4Q6_9AGAR|nr:chondroitin AC/alginate lyase [Macrolepiota fuliginosa MF-IS2]